MKMRKHKNKLIFFSLILLFILSLSTLSIYAWLTDTKEDLIPGNTSELIIDYIVWFDQNENGTYESGTDIDASTYYSGETDDNLKVIVLSTGDETALNYIGKLRIQANITVEGSYYMRARFNHEWFMERTSRSSGLSTYNTINQSSENMMPYGLNAAWYYDTTSNYVYYSSTVTTSGTVSIVATPSLSSYKDFSNTTYITKYFAYLDFELEFVQSNRMTQIWNIDSIPVSGS
ncbi:MAG: hypothetical protein PHY42_03430 [Bacilli bacterium]|nr:hypothetical protein [Bacilli bacterium]